jgi:DNA-binding transcriptional LysR family regulator
MSPTASLLGRLKLRQLSLVLAAEETRNLHRAAERLGLSQPSATKLLQEIEHTLGVRLFERSAQGIVPTAFGSLTVRHARLLLSDLSRLQQDIDGLKDGVSGTVRVGSIVAAVPNLLSRAVALATERHPTVSVSVSVDTSDALLVALQAGRLDFVIGRPLGAVGQRGLCCVSLNDEALCVVSGPGHPLAARTELGLADLASERWILQPEPSPMRRAIEAAFTLQGLPVPPHPVEASSVLATVSLLQHSAMLAVLPRSVSTFYAATGGVVELPVPVPDLLGPYALVSVEDRPVTPAAERLRDILLDPAIRNPDRVLPTPH